MDLYYISEEAANKLSYDYYRNGAKKLNKMVDKILIKLRFSDVDNEDFYDLSSEIFCDVLKRYDGKQDFDGFLYSCLKNKFKTEMTRRNRYKRQADRMAISLETPIGSEDENVVIGDVIAHKDTVEKTVFEENEDSYSRKMLTYLSKLSQLQKEVLRLIIVGYTSSEIKEELHITDRQFNDCQGAIHSYRNVSLLF